ncbi:hypothetical protein [Pseudoalteromonas denitrificans]|uniref:TonB dependent receptor n=1 Tax=Pseudoalteromonas denitrificans DSM 6059 TaxID=1123010 RepID=A0A1I1UE72_9GAMM|nr:hypothetical protein [Pseudoalteromonas denitrificans]SFD69142.1 hypothetical protein SAMN02745724_05208 [Pseudoalteromonas denitrificans DSM 6059]
MLKFDFHYAFNNHSSLHLIGHNTSARYACIDDSDWICGTPKKLDNTFDFRVFYQFKNNNFLVNFGVNRILNDNNHLIQPYRGSQSPILGQGRQIMFDIKYTF